MSAFERVRVAFERWRDALSPPVPVYAHCDIPCGIYDPHEAQLAALTVVRMAQLADELPKPGDNAKPEELDKYHTQMARYTMVREQHADRVKNELRILWGDYFTPEHVKQHPQLHEMFWNAEKLASKARQSASLADGQALLDSVQKIAEVFWQTKNAKTQRVPSMTKAGGELLLPTAGR
jgi:nickel superoxide dismutase